MDFSKGLESLNRSASRAATASSRSSTNPAATSTTNSSTNTNHHRDYNRGGGGSHSRYSPYPIHRNGGDRDRRRGGGSRHRGSGGGGGGGGEDRFVERGGGGGLTESEEEYFLERLVKAIPKYQPIVPLSLTQRQKKPKQRHIALLFLTIDDLPFEYVWKAFIRGISTTTSTQEEEGGTDTGGTGNKTAAAGLQNSRTVSSSSSASTHPKEELLVSVLVHAKFPDRVQSRWLQQRLLASTPPKHKQRHNGHSNNRRTGDRHPHSQYNNEKRDHTGGSATTQDQQPVRYHSRRPEWGSVEITRAMIDLLEEALKIGTSRTHVDDERYASTRFLVTKDEETPDTTAESTTTTIASTSSTSRTSDANSNKPKKQRLTRTELTAKNSAMPTVDKFIFVSESCLPVSTLAEMEAALFESCPDSKPVPSTSHNSSTSRNSNSTTNPVKSYHPDAGKSWINARNTPNNGFARQLQWDPTKAIPQPLIWKADQWLILTRHHAWPLISLIDEAKDTLMKKEGAGSSGGRHDRSPASRVALWQCFRNVKASDEMYFPTTMALLGMIGDNGGDAGAGGGTEGVNEKTDESVLSKEIVKRRITYCDWSMSAKNPETFRISRKSNFASLKEVVKLAREEGCLIARKFTNDSDPRSQTNEESGPEPYITEKEWYDIIIKAGKNKWFP